MDRPVGHCPLGKRDVGGRAPSLWNGYALLVEVPGGTVSAVSDDGRPLMDDHVEAHCGGRYVGGGAADIGGGIDEISLNLLRVYAAGDAVLEVDRECRRHLSLLEEASLAGVLDADRRTGGVDGVRDVPASEDKGAAEQYHQQPHHRPAEDPAKSLSLLATYHSGLLFLPFLSQMGDHLGDLKLDIPCPHHHQYVE